MHQYSVHFTKIRITARPVAVEGWSVGSDPRASGKGLKNDWLLFLSKVKATIGGATWVRRRQLGADGRDTMTVACHCMSVWNSLPLSVISCS
jgi:hypothetical protein